MSDQTIALNTLIIWMLWLAGVGVLVYDILFALSDDLGHIGLALIAGAVMRHVCCLARRLEAQRRDAFEMGRESVRSLR